MTDLQGSFIILKKIKYGEADLILHALSSEGEKMSFLARGALKSKKRFAGGILEPLHHVKLTWANSQRAEIHTIKEAQLLQGFDALRDDYDKLTFALQALDFVARVSMEGDSGSSSMYNLMGHLLKQLEGSQNIAILKTQFFLKFLHQQGVLEVEDWMAQYLKRPISESHLIEEAPSKSDTYSKLMEKAVLNYVKTATVSH